MKKYKDVLFFIMHRLFVNLILISISSLIVVIGQQVQLQSEVRITKAANCDKTRLKWDLQNVSISFLYPRSFLNLDLNVTEDTKSIKRTFVHLDRCNDQGFNCEDFQTWYFDNFCPMLNWRNQVWSDWANALHPPFRCPIKKNIYEGRNITFDFDAVTKWYPESVKYHWKVRVKILNERDELVLCIDMDTHAFQYRKRRRKS